MKLKQLSLNNFRCLENRKIEFDPHFNLIYGRNGQGKTSLIEAVFFLATGKSFRTKKIKELTSFKSQLYELRQSCTSNTTIDHCQIVKNLGRSE